MSEGDHPMVNLVKVGLHWIDPRQVVAIVDATPSPTRIILANGQGMIEVPGGTNDVRLALSEGLSLVKAMREISRVYDEEPIGALSTHIWNARDLLG